MFSLAYALLPVSDTPPAQAIREALAPFQRGTRDTLPESMLAFRDETGELREEYTAGFTFTDLETGGLRYEGGDAFHIDTRKVRDEMRRLGLRSWAVRFADGMGFDEFYDRFCRKRDRHPGTGAYGLWVNPLGEWDWWDLGGRFDGWIMGEQQDRDGRAVSDVSSGPSEGRAMVSRIADVLSDALGHERLPLVDVANDRNIEMVATLLADARAGRDNAYPAALVLPSGAVEDRLRWLKNWPRMGPVETFSWLGLPPDATWEEVVTAAYVHFEGCWAAGIAFHH